jgi:hypothetical protein
MAFSNTHRKRFDEVLKDLVSVGYNPFIIKSKRYDLYDLTNIMAKRRIISTRDEGFLAASVLTSKEKDSVKKHLAHAMMNTDYKTAEDIDKFLKELKDKFPKKYYRK